jgi:hypothetical protein
LNSIEKNRDKRNPRKIQFFKPLSSGRFPQFSPGQLYTMDFVPRSLLEDAKNVNGKFTRKVSYPKTKSCIPKSSKSNTKSQGISSQNRADEYNLEPASFGKSEDEQVIKSPRQSTTSEAEVKYDPTINRYSYTPRETVPVEYESIQADRITEAQRVSDESKSLISRRQVLKLREMMEDLINTLNIGDEQPYSNEMDVFIRTIREETKIYESVFMEVIKQVSVQMIERGEILQEIRQRYMSMFRKIPDRIVGIYNELVAHRKLNRRLSEELQRAQQNIAGLVQDLKSVGIIEVPVLEQNLGNAAAETSESGLHDFYKSQIDRLEARVEQSEKEKTLWMLATTNLSMRISDTFGMKDLQSVFKCEDARVRTTNHMLSIIRLSNSNDYKELEKCIRLWQDEAGSLSREITDLNSDNEHVLSSVKNELIKIKVFLQVNKPENEVEENHQLLKDFKGFDLNFLRTKFEDWVEKLSNVLTRYSKENESNYRARLATCKSVTKAWADTGVQILKRNEKIYSGKDFKKMREVLRELQNDIYVWFSKMETIINGDNGICNNLLNVKTEVEDMFFTLHGLEQLGNTKREQMIKSMREWEGTIEFLQMNFSNIKGNEMASMPLKIFKWIESISDRMDRDHNTRTEGLTLFNP